MENYWIISVFVVYYMSCHALCLDFPMRTIPQCNYPGNVYQSDHLKTGSIRPEFENYTNREKDCCVSKNRYSCCVTRTHYGKECRCKAGLLCEPSAPTSYCNVVSARVLNSRTPYDPCGDFPGVFRVAIVINGLKITVCNAILANTQNTWKLITTQSCVTTVEMALQSNVNLVVETSQHGEDIPLTKFKLENGDKGIGYFNFDISQDSKVAAQLYSACRRLACTLTEAMTGKIDHDNCHVLSYGAIEKQRFSQNGLRQLAVRSATDCLNNDANPGNICYTTKDGGKSLCSGDKGAPVFCKTKDTNENVVVGFVEGNWKFCGEAASFWVAPYQF